MTDEAEIVFDSVGAIGSIKLNRPKALNSLTHDMCRRLDERLGAWEADPKVQAVVIEGAGEKAFCAGGDIRALYDSAREDPSSGREFFADEYRMNSRLYHFSKPCIALIDGIVMGGGVGVSVHGSHRIAGDRTVFAMPETGIGMIPDVGGTFFLSRLAGRLGLFLGLTGARLRAADALHAGVATHYVPSDRHADLRMALQRAAIESAADVDKLLAKFTADLGQAPLAAIQDQIDRAFAPDTVEGIVAALAADGGEWATQTRDTLLAKSPTSLKLTNRQLRDSDGLDFDDGMKLEFRLVCRILEGHDLFEGVRAVLVDKDNDPRWDPATLEGVSDADIDRYFASLGEDELTLPSH